jgi:lysine 2,3-aminomutase
LKPTHVCPVYCRFCFRREVVGPGGEGALTSRELADAVAYVAARPEIFEVILTGGDPLILSPRRLAAIADALADIDHVKVLRVHTRVPVVQPARVTAALVEALRRPALATWIGVHANHPRELTPAAGAALARLSQAGFGLVSQTVLLAGINDDAEVLAALFRGLLAHRVKPYYLHHLDRAPGTARFRVPVARGQEILRALRGRLTGLAQPHYVIDIPGGHGKSPIGPGHLSEVAAGTLTVEDFRGVRHTVPE